jgi:hypothetical protein
MTLHSIIYNVLLPLNVPVYPITYSGEADTYIVYQETGQHSALQGDDKELKTIHYVQVNIVTKSDFNELAIQVKEKMKQAGFTRINEWELYEQDSGYYQKIFQFTYISTP